ncbi:DNA ligase D [Paenibacillus pinisoli]|uniref:DNA ligase D n=1 Tax=Paenibacillus pinisoli TaxID=1276110 RepID=A0A3A6PJS5_9BACL|nr:DNA ligase D [Paenibacillus pinisoli]RJX40610.1 DNA ligase D [Paenibacillus pinisoli]
MGSGLLQPFPKRRQRERYKGVFFITGLNPELDSFAVGVYERGEIIRMGAFQRGLNVKDRETLRQTILHNQIHSDQSYVAVAPAICVELSFQSIEGRELADPAFGSFQLAVPAAECTWDRLIRDNAALHPDVRITHPEKLVWKGLQIDKAGYLAYLIQISPYMLPFLRNRALTLIRCPQGIPGESFFQKDCPDYAPSFIATESEGDKSYIVCNDLSTLCWLGNQLAIELHVPFQLIRTDRPLEIVLDLDPPSREQFQLAVKAAIEMKRIFDSFGIVSYPKISGGKGLQIHIPIGSQSPLTYEDARVFTSFLANYLVEQFPNDFTIERLKKNRGGRLYIDYIQHAAGKTIISPYSARGNEDATVATPLYWEEVNERLTVQTFNIPYVLERLARVACPMSDFFKQENKGLEQVIAKLKEQSSVRA